MSGIYRIVSRQSWLRLATSQHAIAPKSRHRVIPLAASAPSLSETHLGIERRYRRELRITALAALVIDYLPWAYRVG